MARSPSTIIPSGLRERGEAQRNVYVIDIARLRGSREGAAPLHRYKSGCAHSRRSAEGKRRGNQIVTEEGKGAEAPKDRHPAPRDRLLLPAFGMVLRLVYGVIEDWGRQARSDWARPDRVGIDTKFAELSRQGLR